MLEDKLLIWNLNRGRKDALRRIYEKYKHDLVTLASALLLDKAAAEDAVHDVFVAFMQSAEKFRLTGSLKGFLATCVANNARNRNKTVSRFSNMPLEQLNTVTPNTDGPEQAAIFSENLVRLIDSLAELAYEQREAVILHLHTGMTFRAIAQSQGVSINTVQARYRYGLEKLRSLCDGEIEK